VRRQGGQAAALGWLLAAWLATPAPAAASQVILRIQAGNPIDRPQKVQVKSHLPERVTPNDILDRAGLDVGFDIDRNTYYVHREVELGPRQIAVYDVVLRDLWVIPEEELAALRLRAKGLAEKLKGQSAAATAEDLRREVEKGLDQIAQQQAQNAIAAGANPLQHIRAYDANLEALGKVKRLIGRMENLLLAAGIDPGGLVGAAAAEAPRREPELPAEGYRTATIRIQARNTSPTESRKVSIRRDLPREIGPADILDGGGLQIGRDAKTGRSYVYRDSVEIPAGETVTFAVTLRDKWNVHASRLATLRTNAVELLEKVRAQGKYASVEKDLAAIAAAADAIAAEQGPTEVNEQYVAFYRGQRERIAGLEDRLYRIESALRPIVAGSRYGFTLKPPTPKTTWLIIYTIIVFLGLLSLIFMLRWLGRSKAEKLQEGAGSALPPPAA